MSHLLDRLTFFRRKVEDFSNGHGIVTHEDRRWEDGYRKRLHGFLLVENLR
jgi:nitrate reductase alpha subunit